MAAVFEQVRETESLVFVSGQTPLTAGGDVSDDAGEQVRAAVGKIAAQLEPLGLGLESVVKVTYFLTDSDDIADVRAALDAVLPHPRPAASLVVVRALVDPRFRVEIEAIAVRA